MSVTPSFCVELDPALQSSQSRVERFLKWTLLFSRQLALNESHIFNPALFPVLASSEFANLASSRNFSGEAHVLLYASARTVDEIVASKIDAGNGGTDAVVLHLPRAETLKYEALRQNRSLTVPIFYEQFRGYRPHFDRVQSLFLDSDAHRLIRKTPDRYREAAISAIDELAELIALPNDTKARLRDAATKSVGPVRSDLWRALESLPVNSELRRFIRKWGLVLPFNRMLAANDGLEMVYSSDLSNSGIADVVRRLGGSASRAWELDSRSQSLEVGFEEVARIQYGQLARIREQKEFDQHLEQVERAISRGDTKDAMKAMSEHIKFLDSALLGHLGPANRSRSTVYIEMFSRTAVQAGSLLMHATPVTAPFFQRVSESLMLLIKSPRRRALEMVADTITKSAGQ